MSFLYEKLHIFLSFYKAIKISVSERVGKIIQLIFFDLLLSCPTSKTS